MIICGEKFTRSYGNGKKRDLRRKFCANKKGQVRSLLNVNEEPAYRSATRKSPYRFV